MTQRLLFLSALIGLIGACASPPETKPEPPAPAAPPKRPAATETQKPATATTAQPPVAVPLPAPTTENKARQTLDAGLTDYSNGRFDAALKGIHAAIALGLDTADTVNARKHLAFIHCISNRTGACRAEFAHALKVNPALELDAAEAGHPLWGPVFKREKSRLKAATVKPVKQEKSQQ